MTSALRSASRLTAAFALLLVIGAAAAQPPKDPPPSADEQKAREAFREGKFEDALKALGAAGKGNPLLAPPKVVLSRWFLEAGAGEQARLLLEQAAVEDPAHPEVLLTNASYALRENRLIDTVLSCNAAIAQAGDARWDAEARRRFRRDARLGLAAAFEARGDHASVKAQLAALLEADPKNAAVRQRLARSNFLLDRPDDAFAELQAAFKIDPTLDPPELSMAQLWAARQDAAKAGEWFGKAVAAHPDSAKVHRALASHLLDRGKTDAAREHVAAARKIEPDARDTKALVGLLARYARDYPAATAAFEELAKEHPSFGFAQANLAIALAEGGDAAGKRRAVELAEVYAKQNPRLPDARALLAFTLFKAGRAADAGKLAKASLGVSTFSPDGAYFLARVLAEDGPAEDLHKALKAALDSKTAFVYRKEAESLLAELEKKLPSKKE